MKSTGDVFEDRDRMINIPKMPAGVSHVLIKLMVFIRIIGILGSHTKAAVSGLQL